MANWAGSIPPAFVILVGALAGLLGVLTPWAATGVVFAAVSVSWLVAPYITPFVEDP